MKAIYFFLALLIPFGSAAQELYTSIICKNNPNKLPHKSEIINALDSFLRTKNNNLESNKFWMQSDFDLWRQPYQELFNEEISGDKPNYFKPTLLGLIDLEKEKKYHLKIAYISNDDSNNNSIRLIYNLIANLDISKNEIRFEKYTNYYIKDWDSLRIGSILFYKKSINHINIESCKKLNEFNDSIAKFWNLEPIKMVYFSCENPIEMFNLKGYDFYPGMYYARNGGQVFYGGQNSKYKHVVYSGNNSEYYPHEVSHFYINQFFPKSRIASEGVATFLGGSSDKPLNYHLRIFNEYMKKNPEIEFQTLYKSNVRIDNDVTILYSLGGLFSKLIFNKRGVNGLKEFLNIEDNELTQKLPILLGVKPNEWEKYLRMELNKF